MWTLFIRIILRNRLANLIIIALVTIFMGWEGSKVQMSYDFARMLPASDTANIAYEHFKETFGQDGSVMFVGVQDDKLFELDRFLFWAELTEKMRKIEGVDEVVSMARLYTLERNDEKKKFDFVPVMKSLPSSQLELDSLKNKIYSLPFYEGLLFN